MSRSGQSKPEPAFPTREFFYCIGNLHYLRMMGFVFKGVDRVDGVIIQRIPHDTDVMGLSRNWHAETIGL